MRILVKDMAVRHRKLEERSLALHREIAQRIRKNPDLLTRVRERLSKDIGSGRFSVSLTDAMQEWLEILKESQGIWDMLPRGRRLCSREALSWKQVLSRWLNIRCYFLRSYLVSVGFSVLQRRSGGIQDSQLRQK
jgi:hypothetical protein